MASQTNFNLYERAKGFRDTDCKRLSVEDQEIIENALPCPHDPEQLGQLFLKGENKLKMEVEAARKSQNFIVLNEKNTGKFNINGRILPETCLIELQEEHQETPTTYSPILC